MLVYEVHKSMAPTCEYDKSFIIVSYLDIFHIYSNVSITHGYNHDMWVILSCESRAIPWLTYYEVWHLIVACDFDVTHDHHEPLSDFSRFSDAMSCVQDNDSITVSDAFVLV